MGLEIDSLAGLIAESADFDVNNFNIETASDADIDTIGRILTHMNRSRILDINNISSVLEVTDENSILYDTDFTNLPETEEAWDD
ncbi:MAG: hypothetical protein ACOX40_01835 [Bacilli bacterium]